MPRSVKKGPFVDKYLDKKITAASKETNPNKRVITTYSRRSTNQASAGCSVFAIWSSSSHLKSIPSRSRRTC